MLKKKKDIHIRIASRMKEKSKWVYLPIKNTAMSVITDKGAKVIMYGLLLPILVHVPSLIVPIMGGTITPRNISIPITRPIRNGDDVWRLRRRGRKFEFREKKIPAPIDADAKNNLSFLVSILSIKLYFYKYLKSTKLVPIFYLSQSPYLLFQAC